MKDNSKRSNIVLPMQVTSLSDKELKEMNEAVTKTMELSSIKQKLHHYNEYSAAERAEIGRYAAESRTVKACRLLSHARRVM